MFKQTICDQGECNLTSGRKLSQGDIVPGKYGKLYMHIECYACHSYEKFTDQCPDKKPKSVNLGMIGVMLIQNGAVIKRTWILLNTCSIDSVTKNLDYVGDVNNFAEDEDITVLKN